MSSNNLGIKNMTENSQNKYEVTPFSFNNMEIRTLLINNEPYFIAMDVAKILEYSDAEAMVRRLDDDEIQNLQIVGFGNRGVNIINESGLYNAIIGSKKPQAKAFKKWITSEVLPSIRKNKGDSMKLIEIYNDVAIGKEKVNSVNARDLHKALESKQDFSNWIKARIDKLGLIEGIDYVFNKFIENLIAGGRPKVDYYVTIDIAKKICMLENKSKNRYDILKYLDNKLSENKPTIASNNNTIISFSFENYNLDYGILNGEPVFNLNSIASYLGINNPRMSIDIDDTDYVVKINSVVSFTYNRNLNNRGELFLTEAGLYRLILRSNKPEAEKFSKWVTKEVLPSIRKNGGYIANQENLTPEQIVANALIVAQNIIAERDKTIVEQKQVIEYQGNKLDNYKQIELQRRSKQELATSLNRNIRLLAEQRFNKDYGSAYTYIYSKFAELHCINEKINIDFLKKNNDYLAECLSIVLSELD